MKLNLLLYNYILLCSNCAGGGIATCTLRACIGMLLIAKLYIAICWYKVVSRFMGNCKVVILLATYIVNWLVIILDPCSYVLSNVYVH